jgi:hypothetical protein
MAPKFVLVQAHLQDILLLFMFIITEDPVMKNAAKVTEELWIVKWRTYFLTTGLQRAPDCMGLLPSSILFRQNNICMSAALGSQNRGATTVAAESIIAQLHSQSTLTIPRDAKIKQFYTKSKFKSKRTQ